MYIDIGYCSAHIRADQGNAAQEVRLCWKAKQEMYLTLLAVPYIFSSFST